MNICIMRPFNIFGPRQKDSGYGGAISLFSKRVLSNMPPIIYGDGQQTRDYTYVEDVVDAYDLILNYKKSLAEPINFGTGVDIKIIDLANLIIRLLKKEGTLKPVHIEERPGEVRRLIADISRAKAIGWQPKYGIEDGLRKYIDWYKNYRFEEWAKPG